MLELETPRGPARVHLHPVEEPRAALVLGHGAGGGVGAPDLVAATAAALAASVTVALVEQPYRVAGRRSPAPAAQLDEAWTSVVAQLRAGELDGLPLLAGGRSSGARVACRTAAATGATGVSVSRFRCGRRAARTRPAGCRSSTASASRCSSSRESGTRSGSRPRRACGRSCSCRAITACVPPQP